MKLTKEELIEKVRNNPLDVHCSHYLELLDVEGLEEGQRPGKCILCESYTFNFNGDYEQLPGTRYFFEKT